MTGLQELVDQVHDKTGIPLGQAYLLHHGKQIPDYPSRTLAEIGIQADNTMELMGRLCGD